LQFPMRRMKVWQSAQVLILLVHMQVQTLVLAQVQQPSNAPTFVPGQVLLPSDQAGSSRGEVTTHTDHPVTVLESCSPGVIGKGGAAKRVRKATSRRSDSVAISMQQHLNAWYCCVMSDALLAPPGTLSCLSAQLLRASATRCAQTPCHPTSRGRLVDATSAAQIASAWSRTAN
jgi:hypothetical protein